MLVFRVWSSLLWGRSQESAGVCECVQSWAPSLQPYLDDHSRSAEWLGLSLSSADGVHIRIYPHHLTFRCAEQEVSKDPLIVRAPYFSPR